MGVTALRGCWFAALASTDHSRGMLHNLAATVTPSHLAYHNTRYGWEGRLKVE